MQASRERGRRRDILCCPPLRASPPLRYGLCGSLQRRDQFGRGVAILSRIGTPVEARRGLPGDAGDPQSRYVEAAVNGILVAGLYLPQRQSAPGSEIRL